VPKEIKHVVIWNQHFAQFVIIFGSCWIPKLGTLGALMMVKLLSSNFLVTGVGSCTGEVYVFLTVSLDYTIYDYRKARPSFQSIGRASRLT